MQVYDQNATECLFNVIHNNLEIALYNYGPCEFPSFTAWNFNDAKLPVVNF